MTGAFYVDAPLAALRVPSYGNASFRAAGRVTVDGREILQELTRVPISTWSYKTEDSSIRHIGPMAQDLAQLGLGEDSHYINTADANGVALAAIQGLYQIVHQEIDSRNAEIAALRAENAAQQARLAALDVRVSELEQRAKSGGASSPVGLTGGNLLFAGLGLIGLVATMRSYARR